MAQTTTGVKAPKVSPDAPPAQAPTHARPRTAGRHHDAQLPTRSPSQRLHASASMQRGTRLTRRPPASTGTASPHPCWCPGSRRASTPHPRTPHAGTVRKDTHVPTRNQHAPGNKPLYIRQPRARDTCKKIAASAHVMGSGGSAIDTMVIGCLGVERRVERFFSYLAISPESDMATGTRN